MSQLCSMFCTLHLYLISVSTFELWKTIMSPAPVSIQYNMEASCNVFGAVKMQVPLSGIHEAPNTKTSLERQYRV